MLDLSGSPLVVAPLLLGWVLHVRSAEGEVAVRLTEVEAYLGLDDSASHAFRGPTPRTSVMFGEPGRLYVYLSYGIHHAVNIVCYPAGTAGAVLLRAGEVVVGRELAAARRARVSQGRGSLSAVRGPIPPERLASGPGNLGAVLGLSTLDSGAPIGENWELVAPSGPVGELRSGPRVGVSAAADRPWRFWLAGERTVSNWRPAKGAKARDPGPRSAS